MNLLMALKLPGQVYDEGNFFPKEDTSDSEEPDLPPLDAELTKRPKRVPGHELSCTESNENQSSTNWNN